MWRASLGLFRQKPISRLRSSGILKPRFVRQYNLPGNQQQIPHTTYFQQPPPPPPRSRWGWRILRTIGLSTAFFGFGVMTALALVSVEVVDSQEFEELLDITNGHHLLDSISRRAPSMTVRSATVLLELFSNFGVQSRNVTHCCRLPANAVMEDTHYLTPMLTSDLLGGWNMWGVYDGHAGRQTSQYLADTLAKTLHNCLGFSKCFHRPFVPNDAHIFESIRQAFLSVDDALLDVPKGALPDGLKNEIFPSGLLDAETPAIVAAAAMFAGSCALVALFDPVNSVLRVANVGDSRAVLGRWDDATSRYKAVAMSADHTGFNPNEIERLTRQHPGEDIIDPATGRVHGIMVSRAFGDSRWKWPQTLSEYIHKHFWGPKPLDATKNLTPPYLTAEPEIMEARIHQNPTHPDFLILASDGLWDNMSSADAVACVQLWLDRHEPDAFVEQPQEPDSFAVHDIFTNDPNYMNTIDVRREPPEPDTYYDPVEGCRKWRVSPKYFVVEDANCAVHVIKNALGGSRRRLFTELMALQPPLARKVLDDITVQVVFFGGEYAWDEEAARRGRDPLRVLRPARKRT